MITVLIVEDERRIREGLLTHIPWKQIEIQKVRAAEHAEEAYALCKTFTPDIIVSDICMPGMNGVELCRKLREYFPESQIIFVTGYAQKEYLMAAIDLHAIRFVEKPVRISEVVKALEMAVDEVKKVRSYGNTLLHRLLKEGGNSRADEKIYSVFLLETQQGDREEQKNQFVGELETLAEAWKIRVLGAVLDTGEIALLLSREKPVSEDKWLMHEVYEIFFTYLNKQCRENVFLAIGKDVQGQHKVSESYESAQRALKCLGFMGWNHYAYEKDLPTVKQEYKLNNGFWDSFMDAVAKNQVDQLEEMAEEVYQLLTEKKIVLSGEVRHLYYSLNRLVDRMNRTCYPGEAADSSALLNSGIIDQAKTLKELHLFLVEKIQTLNQQGDEQKNTAAVQKIKEYICNHYDDKALSVKLLADYVYLTPTYLSNLFKKTTGYTIGQYLVEVRIGEAKRMIKNPEYKLYQIASLVGYEDSDYFTKIFKKKTGMTPSEYRKKVVI